MIDYKKIIIEDLRSKIEQLSIEQKEEYKIELINTIVNINIKM